MQELKPLKIGILGGIRAGKDTVGKIVANELKKINPYRSTKFLYFSEGIHEVIRLTMPYIYERGKPRKELQKIGQSIRELDENVWVNMLFNSSGYHVATYAGMNIIITDVRQVNEAERLQKEGFKIIKVVASKDIRLARARSNKDSFTTTDFEHETEKSVELCPFDYMINNNGSLEELTEQVKTVLTSIIEEGIE